MLRTTKPIITAFILAGLSTVSQAASTLSVSVDAAGNPGDDSSGASALSRDGNYVVFESKATNFSGNSTGKQQIYLRNIATGSTTLVSSASNGAHANNFSRHPDISDDGKKIVFATVATNLGSTNGASQVYLWTQGQPGVKLLSSKNGVGGNGDSDLPFVSDNGRFVVFQTNATDLISSDSNGVSDIVVIDLNTGVMDRVNVSSQGIVGNGHSVTPVVNADGTVVAFSSIANNLAGNDGNNNYDIFVRNRQTGETRLVSRAPNGYSSNGRSSNPAISADGRYVAFQSNASDLLGSSTNTQNQIYIYDWLNDDLKLASRTPAGGFGDKLNINPAMSANGRFVVFSSFSTNLLVGDTNGVVDAYIYDQFMNTMEIASLSNSGALLNSNISFFTAISGDGRAVSFASNSSLLNGNGKLNIYRRLRDPIQNILPVANAGPDQNLVCSGSTTSVALDGSLSSDIDGNIISFNWTGGFGSASGVSPVVYLTPGLHNVNLGITDDLQGTDNDSVNISIADNTPPTLNIASVPTLEATHTTGAAFSVSYSTTDNCSSVTVTVNPTPLHYPLGNNSVTVTATDSSGNKTSKVANILVVDTTPPVLTAPAGVNAEAEGYETVVAIGNASATDIFPFTIGNNAPAAFSLGTTPVTWTAQDINGNTSSAIQNVTVADTTAPVLQTPPDIFTEALASLTSVDIGEASATDIFPVTIANDDPGQFPIGATTVHWTATDANGNASTGQQRITVADTIAPVITVAASSTVEATAATGTPYTIPYSVTDSCNCGTISTSLSPDLSAYPLGETSVTITATDQSANTATAIHSVKVVDTTAPVLTLPAHITMEASAVLTPVDIGQATAQDIFAVDISHSGPAGYPLGSTDVVWTAKDVNGNAVTGVQKITIKDTTAPELFIPTDLVLEATAAQMSIQLGIATADDIFNVAISNDAPALFGLGVTNVVWTATDANGNSTHATQKITLVDTTPPVVDAGADQILEATSVNGALFKPAPVVTDSCNCGDLVISIAPSQTTFPLGQTTVVVTATDQSGNSASDSMVVTVRDTTPPQLTVPANILLEASGALTSVSIGQASASDIFAVTLSHDAPALFPVGNTAVTWKAVDANGNVSTGVQVVSVVDTTAPTFGLIVDKETLWPPRFNMVLAARVTDISDLVDATPTVDIQVSSNDDNHFRRHRRLGKEDWEIKQNGATWEVWLRAEKLIGTREDRVYTVEVTVADMYQNVRADSAEVVVPHRHPRREHDDNSDRADKHEKSDRKHSHVRDNDNKRSDHDSARITTRVNVNRR